MSRTFGPTDHSPTERSEWTRVCQALRSLLKDKYHFEQEAAAGEGEAFEKLSHIRLCVQLDGKELSVRVVIRSMYIASALFPSLT